MNKTNRRSRERMNVLNEKSKRRWNALNVLSKRKKNVLSDKKNVLSEKGKKRRNVFCKRSLVKLPLVACGSPVYIKVLKRSCPG